MTEFPCQKLCDQCKFRPYLIASCHVKCFDHDGYYKFLPNKVELEPNKHYWKTLMQRTTYNFSGRLDLLTDVFQKYGNWHRGYDANFPEYTLQIFITVDGEMKVPPNFHGTLIVLNEHFKSTLQVLDKYAKAILHRLDAFEKQ